MNKTLFSLLIIFTVIAISGCSSNPPTQVSLGSDFCNLNNLKLIIPDRIYCNMEESTGLYEEIVCKRQLQSSGVSIDYFWKDGTPLTFISPFTRGDETGENVNYYYSNWGIGYNKIPISPDGTLGKRIMYGIDLAIDPNDKTDSGYKIVQYRCCHFSCTDESYKMIG